jgi:outer membrane protein assembly factor BamB
VSFLESGLIIETKVKPDSRRGTIELQYGEQTIRILIGEKPSQLRGGIMRKITAFLALTVVVAVAGVSAPNQPADGNKYWPQWRGPLASGVAPEGDPPVEWAADKNIKWKVEIPGKGSATPIVWGDTIFVLTAAPTDKRPPGKEGSPAETAPAPGAQAGRPRDRSRDVQPEFIQQFVVIAISRKDGRTLWRKVVREELPHEGWNPNATITWASSSPVTDGQMVYAHFGSRGLYALDMKGNVKWERDFGDMDTGGFGEGSSPALDGKRLVVTWDHDNGSFIVALDKNTGKELWRTPRDEKTTWSTPIIVEHRGKKQVITAGTKVRSYDLADGQLLWEGPGLGSPGCVASPVHANGVVHVMNGKALYGIRLAEAKGDITAAPQAFVWKDDRNAPWVPSPLLYGDELYFLKGNSAILSVFNARTGEKLYGEKRLEGLLNVYASPVGAAGRIYIAGRDGGVAVIASGREFKMLALNQLDDGFDASPVVVGNELYLRGRKHLYRISKD